MNYLITGGAGFIGSHLSERLLKEGHNIYCIDSLTDYYDVALKYKNIKIVEECSKLNHKLYEFHKGDIRDYDFLCQFFQSHKIDAIIHLAANAGVRPSIDNPRYYVDVNLMGLTNMLECAKNYKVRSFVFISSSSVYGNNKKVPFHENDNVDEPISPYAATKKAGELICHTYHALYGINIACLRYFTVYGPRQRPDLAINKFTRLMLEDQEVPMYGDGSTSRDYTFVSDIVEGTVLALNWTLDGCNKYDVFNLGGSHPISLKDLIMLIGKVLGIEPKINQLSMQPGDVNITYSDSNHAKEILHYNPKVKIQEGLEKFIEWYYKMYKVKH
ncbi:MAG: NAD-dependent epimerase/dehydratase family protein [Clostridia bacterium]|nr:NAD-dependent epimerase/dehydratase family protein [Clostridia bacterium]